MISRLGRANRSLPARPRTATIIRLASFALLLTLCLANSNAFAQKRILSPPVYDWARTTRNAPQPSPLAERLPIEIGFFSKGLVVDKSDAAIYGPALMAGFLGPAAAIGTATSEEKAAQEMRATVESFAGKFADFDFNAKIEAALRTKLAGDGISPSPAISVFRMYPQGESDPFEARAAERILTIYPYFSVNHELTELRTKLFVQIVERRIDGKGRINDKANFNRIYTFAFQIEEGKPEESLQRWNALERTALTGMLGEGIAQVTDMIAYDFSTAGRREWQANTLKKSTRLKGRLYRGLPVRETQDWVWVRTGTKLQGFEGYKPIESAIRSGKN